MNISRKKGQERRNVKERGREKMKEDVGRGKKR